MSSTRVLSLGLVLAAVLAATWQRARLVEGLPPDFDEKVYLPVAYRYADMLSEGRWGDVMAYRENFEHPPLVKLLFAGELLATGAPEPDWETVKVGRPVPEPAVPAFRVTRWLSAVSGIAQVGLTAGVSPLGALGLALDPYHAKYTSQAYLEGVAGLFAVLAVLAFERARRAEKSPGTPFRPGPLLLSGALLGVAAAGKYPYGMVVGLAVLPFLVAGARTNVKLWAAFVLPAVAAFLLTHPALWSSPLESLWASLTFHWDYSHSEHVRRAALPWDKPIEYLRQAEPLKWHPGLFATGINARVLPSLAVIGVPRTWLRRPVWAVWAVVGMAFLLVWPTKWPQYLLLVLPALSVCAGMGVATLGGLALWGLRKAGGRLPWEEGPSSGPRG